MYAVAYTVNIVCKFAYAGILFHLYKTTLVKVWRMFSYTGFDCLRVWGITEHSISATAVVLILSVFDPAINIVCPLPEFL